MVNADGTGLTVLESGLPLSEEYEGGVTFSSTIDFEDGLPIENNKFTLEFEGVYSMEFKGTFSNDGTRASGSWAAGACSGKWKATKS